jgi:Fe-S cluster biogenesis protein NfuA
MQDTSDERDLLARMQEVDAMIESIDNPDSQARLMEIVQTLLEFHNVGLRKILDFAVTTANPQKPLAPLCNDPIVSNLLLLHGLHPLDLESRVRGALEKVAPYLASHGGHVELVSIGDAGDVNLRLEGSCRGCPSSRVTLQSTIEQELLTAAPEISAIHVEGLVEAPPAPAGFVPIENLTINASLMHAAAS